MSLDDVWLPDISAIGGPRYLALASAIAEAINSGELPPGTRLPPQRELARKLRVTVGTVGRAYTVIQRRALADGQVGRGTFVRGVDQKGAVASYLPRGNPGTIDLVCFRIPLEEIAETLASAVSEVADHTMLLPLVGYAPEGGYLSHRTAGAAWIARSGLEIPADAVIACAGGQQAIATAVLTVARLGGPILSETLTYSGLKSIAALRGINIEGVEVDEEGMLPDALREAARKTGGRVAYLQPTVHNPLGCSMSQARREKIAEVARAEDLVLIEDDVAAAGLTERYPPIAALAPERAIYITSLSKCVSPALRTGFMAAPASLLEQLSTTLHSLSLGNSPIVLETASLMISSGAADRMAERNAEELARRHEAALRELAGLRVRSNAAGFFIWLTLPERWTSEEFAKAVQRVGVSVVGAESFSVGSAAPPHAVRLSLSPSSGAGSLAEGLRKVRRMLESHPSPKRAVI